MMTKFRSNPREQVTDMAETPKDRCGTSAGPQMRRHIIDGHVVYLPADSIISPRIKSDELTDAEAAALIDNVKLSGTF